MATHADPRLDPETGRHDEFDEGDLPTHAEGDSRLPAASLTSIQLKRRRRGAEPRLSAPEPQPQTPEAQPKAAELEPKVAAPKTVETQGQGAEPRPTAADLPPNAVAPRHEAGQAQPEPGSARVEAEPGAADAETPARYIDIVDYWSQLGSGRLPAPSALDAELIARTWPNAVLLRCGPGERDIRAAALYRSDSAEAEKTGRAVDFNPMIVQWMISLAIETVRRRCPVAERETFDGPEGPVHFVACALPLSEDRQTVDHVLCHLRSRYG